MKNMVVVRVQFFVEGDTEEELQEKEGKIIKELEQKFPYVDVEAQEEWD
jgi:hypothetical protein